MVAGNHGFLQLRDCGLFCSGETQRLEVFWSNSGVFWEFVIWCIWNFEYSLLAPLELTHARLICGGADSPCHESRDRRRLLTPELVPVAHPIEGATLSIRLTCLAFFLKDLSSQWCLARKSLGFPDKSIPSHFGHCNLCFEALGTCTHPSPVSLIHGQTLPTFKTCLHYSISQQHRRFFNPPWRSMFFFEGSKKKKNAKVQIPGLFFHEISLLF